MLRLNNITFLYFTKIYLFSYNKLKRNQLEKASVLCGLLVETKSKLRYNASLILGTALATYYFLFVCNLIILRTKFILDFAISNTYVSYYVGK